MRHISGLALLVILASPHAAEAQPRPSGGNHAVVWTVIGAGAGFGVGVFTGLAAFDDAINSNRKVWTCAIVGAAVGGTLGYLVGRHHHRGTPALTSTQPRQDRRATLDQHDVRQLAATIRLDAGRLNPSPLRPTTVHPHTPLRPYTLTSRW